LDQAKFKELVANAEYEQRYEEIYFLCGPEGIMSTAQNVLNEIGVPDERIHTESFFSAAAEQAKADAKAGIAAGVLTRDVKITLEGEDHLVTVSPDKTILEAGLEAGLDMPYSCQSGLCTACRGRITSGKVKMDEDAGLSPKEIEEGYILCCSSRAESDDIKITIE
jgi:ring-1,2-phenylacetyl-CoA epoxidase subunit PaaE